MTALGDVAYYPNSSYNNINDHSCSYDNIDQDLIFVTMLRQIVALALTHTAADRCELKRWWFRKMVATGQMNEEDVPDDFVESD